MGINCNSMIEFHSCYITDSNELPIESVLRQIVTMKILIDRHVMNSYSCDSRFKELCFITAFTKRNKYPLEVISRSGCYHYFDREYVAKDCVANLEEKRSKLCESDSDECKHCLGKDCNWKPFFQKCITTNSKNGTDLQLKIYTRYKDQYFIHVSGDTVRRGCISDITESTNDGIGINIKDCDNNEICEKYAFKDDCNYREVAQEHCIVCSTTTNENYRYYLRILKEQCPLNLKEFACYLYMGANRIVKHDCVSQLTEERRDYC